MPTAQYVARAFLVAKYNAEYKEYCEEEKAKRQPTDHGQLAYERARTRLVSAHRSEYEKAYKEARAKGYKRNANKRWPHSQDRKFKGGS